MFSKSVKKYVDKIITVNNDEICAAIKDVFEELEIEPIFAPVYSPDLNPIEFVFLIIKNMRWAKNSTELNF